MAATGFSIMSTQQRYLLTMKLATGLISSVGIYIDTHRRVCVSCSCNLRVIEYVACIMT